MKKLLLTFFVVLSIILTGINNKGAAMNNEITQVRASHILVEDEKSANELKSKIENNEITFEQAAQKYSSCPSKANGGDLGYFGRNMMVKEFEDASFNGDVGKISQPVKTQFGWHLIKVTDKK